MSSASANLISTTSTNYNIKIPHGSGTYKVGNSPTTHLPYLSPMHGMHVIQLLSIMFSGKIIRYINHASPKLSKLLPKKTAEEYIAQNIPPFIYGEKIFDESGNLQDIHLPKEILRWYRAKSVEDEFEIDVPQTSIEMEEAIQWLKNPMPAPTYAPGGGTPAPQIPAPQIPMPAQPIWVAPMPYVPPTSVPLHPGVTYTICATDNTNSSK